LLSGERNLLSARLRSRQKTTRAVVRRLHQPACAAGKKQPAPWFDGCTSPPAQQAKNNPRRGSTAAPARLRSRQLAAR